MICERDLNFEKLRNCRDLGGMQAAGGRTIRKNCLIRASNLWVVTREDQQKLTGEHRLSLVIDLRTDIEREQKPDRLPKGVDYLMLPVFTAAQVGITREKRTTMPDVKDLPGMDKLYQLMTADEFCRKNFRTILRSILLHDYEEGSVLWHCTEGKDRCGMIAVFLEEILGVDREAIREDYFLTNRVNEPRGDKAYRIMMEQGFDEAAANYIRDSYLAKPEYLDAAYEVIDGMFGGMENYLMKGLELEPEWIETFREQVLE